MSGSSSWTLPAHSRNGIEADNPRAPGLRGPSPKSIVRGGRPRSFPPCAPGLSRLLGDGQHRMPTEARASSLPSWCQAVPVRCRGLRLRAVGRVGLGAPRPRAAGRGSPLSLAPTWGASSSGRGAAVVGARRAGILAGGGVRGREPPGRRARLRLARVRRRIHRHAERRVRAFRHGARGPPRLAADAGSAGRPRVRGEPRRDAERERHRRHGASARHHAEERDALVIDTALLRAPQHAQVRALRGPAGSLSTRARFLHT